MFASAIRLRPPNNEQFRILGNGLGRGRTSEGAKVKCGHSADLHGLSLIGLWTRVRIIAERCVDPSLWVITLFAALICGVSSAQAATVTIGAAGMSFSPTSVTINAGDTVTWNVTSGTHTVTSDTAIFDSGTLVAPTTYSHTFPTAGDFPFHCNFHVSMGMTGVVHVLSSTPPTITSAPPTDGVLGSAYSYTLTATGTPTITYALTAGSLPNPLTLSAGGVISGTPNTLGTVTGTITANNGVSPAATQNFSITISAIAIAPVITSSAPPGGTVSAPYTFTYIASGTGPITYSVTSGTLPGGLALSTGGVLSGTPTTAGTYSGVVTASNGTSPDSTQGFTIAIAASGGGGGGGPYGNTQTGGGCGIGTAVSLLGLGLLVMFRRLRFITGT